MHHFHLKNKEKFWGGTPPFPRPSHWGGGIHSSDLTPDLAPSIENLWVRPCFQMVPFSMTYSELNADFKVTMLFNV